MSGKQHRKRQMPFYDLPGFEKEVDEMPVGKEKSHLEALLKRLKPKQIKTMQQQMEEHLARKQEELKVSPATQPAMKKLVLRLARVLQIWLFRKRH